MKLKSGAFVPVLCRVFGARRRRGPRQYSGMLRPERSSSCRQRGTKQISRTLHAPQPLRLKERLEEQGYT